MSNKSTQITARSGLVTAFEYEHAGRRIAVIRGANTLDASTNSFAYDSVGRMLRQTNAFGFVTTNSFNLLDQMTSTTDPLLNTTTVTYDVSGNRLVETKPENVVTSWLYDEMRRLTNTTYADGAVRNLSYHADGRLARSEGTAVHGVRYEFGWDGIGRYRKEVKLLTDGTDSQEWTKTYSDSGGRTIRHEYADGAFTTTSYDVKGNLVSSVDPDGVTQLFSYDPAGNRIYSVVDVNQNGLIDLPGIDRITRSTNYVSAGIAISTSKSLSEKDVVFEIRPIFEAGFVS
jgi:YD repeat-containing protein